MEAAFGWTLGLLACAVLSATLALALLTDRDSGWVSRDPVTGLPDRTEALRRLEALMSQPLGPIRQGALLVVRCETNGAALLGTIRIQIALRLARALRKGDRIVLLGDDELGAIIAPAQGIEARSVRSILDRIAESLRKPIEVDGTSHVLTFYLGACLQRDAPGGHADAWLEAAESATMLARDLGEPCLFWSASAYHGGWSVDQDHSEDLRRRSA